MGLGARADRVDPTICQARHAATVGAADNDCMSRLDVVIPAYKARYLPCLLQSLVAQTARGFRVWVVDDASPEPIEATCAPYMGQLDLRYYRFETNLGGRDLAGHWNRAVALTDAPWVILPGDDDVFDPGCLQALLRHLDTADLSCQCLSFAVRTIDAEDRQLAQSPATRCSDAADFLLQRLRSQVMPVTIGYAFARQAFDRAGGFVSFDRGWHSDDASWALFGAAHGIEPVPGGSVAWRQSEANISPQMRTDPRRTLAAHLSFLQWLTAQRMPLGLDDARLRELADAVAAVMRWELAQAPLSVWLQIVWPLSCRIATYTDHSVLSELLLCVKWRI